MCHAIQVTDITGVIDHGMWNLAPPFTDIHIVPFPPISWMGNKSFGLEYFEGMHSQTGTYLETPAHYYGNQGSYLLTDVPVERLYNIPCVVLNLGLWTPDRSKGRQPITRDRLQSCSNAGAIQPGDAILIGTGWGRYWMEPETMNCAPYLTKGAMDWLLEQRPVLLGGDFPQWDTAENPQGFFEAFYSANVLMGGPFVNLERIGPGRCNLTILPIKVCHTSCAPARAIIVEQKSNT